MGRAGAPAGSIGGVEEARESRRSGRPKPRLPFTSWDRRSPVGAAETAEILQHLEQLAREAPSLLTKVNDETLAQNLSRTSHALERRITVWKQIGRMGGMIAADAPAPAVDPRSFNKCLNEIDQLTSNSSEGHAWRKYLLIESLHDWAARRRNNDERLPHDLAQQVLKRLNQMSVTSHQRQFLTTGPMAALHQEMVRHTAEAGGIESFAAAPGELREERAAQRRPAAGARLPIPGGRFRSGAAGVGRADRDALSQRQHADCRQRRVAQSHDSQAGAGVRAGQGHDPERAGSRPEPDGKRNLPCA